MKIIPDIKPEPLGVRSVFDFYLKWVVLLPSNKSLRKPD